VQIWKEWENKKKHRRSLNLYQGASRSAACRAEGSRRITFAIRETRADLLHFHTIFQVLEASPRRLLAT
jgi:hypothetical protein